MLVLKLPLDTRSSFAAYLIQESDTHNGHNTGHIRKALLTH